MTLYLSLVYLNDYHLQISLPCIVIFILQTIFIFQPSKELSEANNLLMPFVYILSQWLNIAEDVVRIHGYE
jgi:hypothetical protein